MTKDDEKELEAWRELHSAVLHLDKGERVEDNEEWPWPVRLVAENVGPPEETKAEPANEKPPTKFCVDCVYYSEGVIEERRPPKEYTDGRRLPPIKLLLRRNGACTFSAKDPNPVTGKRDQYNYAGNERQWGDCSAAAKNFKPKTVV